MSWSDVAGKVADKITRENIVSVSVAGMLAWIIYQVPGKLDTMISQNSTIIQKLDDCARLNRVANK